MFIRRIKKQFTIRASDDGNLLHPNEGTPINTSSHKSSVRLGNDNSFKDKYHHSRTTENSLICDLLHEVKEWE